MHYRPSLTSSVLILHVGRNSSLTWTRALNLECNLKKCAAPRNTVTVQQRDWSKSGQTPPAVNESQSWLSETRSSHKITRYFIVEAYLNRNFDSVYGDTKLLITVGIIHDHHLNVILPLLSSFLQYVSMKNICLPENVDDFFTRASSIVSKLFSTRHNLHEWKKKLNDEFIYCLTRSKIARNVSCFHVYSRFLTEVTSSIYTVSSQMRTFYSYGGRDAITWKIKQRRIWLRSLINHALPFSLQIRVCDRNFTFLGNRIVQNTT